MLLETHNWSGTECLEISTPPSTADAPVGHPASAQKSLPPGLTGREQCVVAISLFDHRSSIYPPVGMARLFGRLFGSRPVNQLADPKLEALRRYCILLRTNDEALPPMEIDRIRTAGYSDAALAEVRRLLAGARPRR
ncbi:MULTISPECIES: hypothetical protein [unclassified Sphingomonas]|uniref:hypothetical protein n=1 Tax=unclassified Sphingomonas TaxID=196159 RepID=UPI0006F54BF3|nr:MULTISPECIES: hypothetical protein [unclassified Sphingomonas]KQX25018.1 hypothetical protein ASD17_23315 [Sphingomonas sp. Root1294]KQY66035.1 hypothetical protein ASD39_13115 [Sphingomonas sp. Root50]KRB89800.1 hypothetical protein ASE22_19480 [Sphingomonas sp. Root720]